MTSLDQALGDRMRFAVDASARDSLWRRFLKRVVGTTRTSSEAPDQPMAPSRRHPPVFRITRVSADRWVVLRPGSTIEHAFDNAAGAEAFVRHECRDMPGIVELRIGELYVAAHFDSSRPSLFGAPG